MDDELSERLAAIEQRLDAQLVWQAAVLPVLLALLEATDTPAVQLRIVSLIEQADALGLWSMLTAAERGKARDYAEQLRSWPEHQRAQAPAETGRPDSRT